MFLLKADKNKLILLRREPLTSGSVNVNTIKFEFSTDWDGLTRTAVFRNNTENRSILLDGTNQCEIPQEVLSAAEQRVYAGVYGTRGQETVLPTIWTSLGVVLAGAAPDGGTYPPTPELWEQELAKKQDKLHGEPGQLVGFDESGNAVAQDSGEAMQGPPGPQGVPGKDGKSAYQIAVDGGFEGTEEEWLESLQGPPGKDGAPGPAGTDGSPGADGTTFTPAVSADGTLSWTNDGNMSNPAPVNIKGPAGANGADGTDGENGVGVPAGGATGQILAKKTAADYDTQWIDAPQSGGGSGGESLDIYSTEETRIGTWIDGRPVYRKVFETTSPSVVGMSSVLSNDLLNVIDGLINVSGWLMSATPAYCPFPFFIDPADCVSVWVRNGSIMANIQGSWYLNRPMHVVLEYTKASDRSEIA